MSPFSSIKTSATFLSHHFHHFFISVSSGRPFRPSPTGG
jgi:hypothetical protein